MSSTERRPLSELTEAELETLENELAAEYETIAAKGLGLDLTRGKPSAAQLDLSERLLGLPEPGDHMAGKTDVRNYGGIQGLPELRAIFAELLDVRPEQLYAEDNASLSVMYDLISFALLCGTTDSPRPWIEDQDRKWICLVPGYDRHFAVTEKFGFEMLPVEMGPEGPDMDEVERLAADPSVKGMWAVPIYSNPTGLTLSDHVVERLAKMETGAPDFRVIWDNAYAVHTLVEDFPKVPGVLEAAASAGHPNRFWQVASTSKITFAGAGVAFLAAQEGELAWYGKNAGVRTIGPNKVNQLAHVRFFGDAEGVRQHMQAHREIIAPKFAASREALESRLGGYEVASWTDPEGGYFIDLSVVDGTASEVVSLTAGAGVALTPAGAAYPYGKDPHDRHIRLAPTMPPLEEVTEAIEVVALCTLLAAVRRAQAGKGK
ncbi:aminotransferase class I/II-fold pyridoxal phosphate-dependent enzyme [Dietzia sp.]|uniref:aminotransferase class I/II-fold pyridoxal phosphate-dependent enzyme n=1 Tax=Dietzia sp. TaxID=1871616 RepID=UPI002FDB31E5